MKTFTCTHPGHEGDRETEGVPFGPRGEEWCQACWFLEQDLMSGGDLIHPAGLTITHPCGHRVYYPDWDESTLDERSYYRERDCDACLGVKGRREAVSV